MTQFFTDHTRKHWFYSWCIHIFTASGTLFGLFALYAIFESRFVQAFWLMAAAIVIDGVDGTLARRIDIEETVPEIDGALLDNIVDYLNYAVVPACFLLVADLLPIGWNSIGAGIVLFASAYQFCQSDAKTKDHFFKGFPSFWNIAIFYLFFWETGPWINLMFIVMLTILSFVPIKYVYPSQLDNLTRNIWLKRGMGVATVIWGLSTLGLLWLYPDTSPLLLSLSLGYVFLYLGTSLYRTFVPLRV